MRFDYPKNRPQSAGREIHYVCGKPMLGIDEDDPRSWHWSTLLDKSFCDCPQPEARILKLAKTDDVKHE